MSRNFTGLLAWGVLGAVFLVHAADDKAVLLLMKARTASATGQTDQALTLISQAIEADPSYLRAYLLRGSIYDAAERYADALADYDEVVKLGPRVADHYNLRGSLRFKLGRFESSIADFDKSVELEPRYGPNHWQRGLACFYAGRYEEGVKQFESCHASSPNDVENAVWHYLCNARSEGVKEAQASLLKVAGDGRVPMMQVYSLYGGMSGVEDVMAAARAGEPSPALNEQLFYAHLYIGLYYDAQGNTGAAAKHVTQAVEHKIDHFMWDIARLHAERLRGGGSGN